MEFIFIFRHYFADISVEKYRQRLPTDKSGFGRTFVHVKGPNADQLFIADHTIRIPFPGNSSLRSLNLIYTREGQVNLPVNHRNGVFRLLKDNFHHLVDVTSVPEEEKPQILADITDGKFDLIATADENSQTLPPVPQKALLPVKDSVNSVSRQSSELQLLRIWRTGEFFTYNHKTGNLNKLKDKRVQTFKSHVRSTRDTYKVLPDDRDWNYAFNEQNNFYKKYLIQDAISKGINPENIQSLTNQTNLIRLPPLNLRQRNQKRYPVHKSWSFYTVTKETDSFYKKFLRGELPLQRSLTDSVERRVHRLTRSNVLRHEFYQVKSDCFKCQIL